uniref:Uncharacterized protein n=1 Tax=Panagrolaimus sp. PS1159 TaxID=55785 RepID=A0AC35GX92_9BILA
MTPSPKKQTTPDPYAKNPSAADPSATAAASTSTASTSTPRPNIPMFVYDAGKPHSAAIWFAQLSISFRLYPCTPGEKVALTLNALDTPTFE